MKTDNIINWIEPLLLLNSNVTMAHNAAEDGDYPKAARHAAEAERQLKFFRLALAECIIAENGIKSLADAARIANGTLGT